MLPAELTRLSSPSPKIRRYEFTDTVSLKEKVTLLFMHPEVGTVNVVVPPHAALAALAMSARTTIKLSNCMNRLIGKKVLIYNYKNGSKVRE